MARIIVLCNVPNSVLWPQNCSVDAKLFSEATHKMFYGHVSLPHNNALQLKYNVLWPPTKCSVAKEQLLFEGPEITLTVCHLFGQMLHHAGAIWAESLVCAKISWRNISGCGEMFGLW